VEGASEVEQLRAALVAVQADLAVREADLASSRASLAASRADLAARDAEVAAQAARIEKLAELRELITEWRRHAVVCPHCGFRTRASYDPEVIPRFAFGPRLMAVVGLLTGA